MSDRSEVITCAEARELAPETAIGVATAEDRARLLGHVATCAECAAYLNELSGLVDDVVALAPNQEPPPGFESELLARLERLGSPPQPRSLRWWRVGLVAAALALVAGVSALAVHRANEPDRTLADRVRATLTTANGQYFAAAPLVGPDANRHGVLFAYQGEPSWMFLTIEGAVSFRGVSVELVGHDGSVRPIGQPVDLSPSKPWGTVIPVAVHDVAVVRVVDAAGALVLSARVIP